MPQSSLPQLQLQNVVYQQQDATIFNGAAIPAIAASPEAFLIFYLNQPDEQNGYGTVIQLDNETKQAAIFADLNPEYSHLFYIDEQQQLQTLLWCIEFATRTAEGLFVTQGKVYGRGISEAEIQAMIASSSQQAAATSTPNPAPQPATEPMPAPMPPVATAPQPVDQPMSVEPAASYAEPLLPPQPAPQSMAQPAYAAAVPDMTPAVPDQPYAPPAYSEPVQQAVESSAVDVWSSTQTAAPAPQPMAPANQPTGLPDLAAWDQNYTPTNVPSDELQLPPLADMPPMPAAAQPQPMIEPAAQAVPELQLPPLPTLPQFPEQAAPVNQPAWPAPLPDTAPMAPPPVMDQPMAPMAPPQQATQLQPALQQDQRAPVGRPPKPLVQDQLWMISAEDFVWLKSISRQPLDTNKELLRQKVIAQIQRNQPALAENWQFHGAFEQAFEAVSLTYELVPGLRHDLLKSLLNGRIVDSIVKTL